MVGIEDVAGLFGTPLARLRHRNVVDRVPVEQHQAGGDVDLLDLGVHHLAVQARQPHRRDRDEVGVALRRDLELVQVHRQAVGGVDGGDLLVLVVEDDPLAPAAARIRAPLIPGQHRLPVQVLHPEVGDDLLLGQRVGVKPEQLALGVEDHRPVLGRAELGSHEDVALRGRCRCLADRDRGGLEVGPRSEVLQPAGAGGDRGDPAGGQLIARIGDLEAERPLRRRRNREVRGDRDRLSGGERLGGEEAPALAV